MPPTGSSAGARRSLGGACSQSAIVNLGAEGGWQRAPGIRPPRMVVSGRP
jgi:hypothetical protein